LRITTFRVLCGSSLAALLATAPLAGDCQLHIEFVVRKGSNSGAYLQGNYEIQILDSYGKPEVTYSDCGAIYPAGSRIRTSKATHRA